jgi:hypothetical protein
VGKGAFIMIARVVPLAAVAVLALLAAGCGGRSSGTPPVASATTSSTTATATPNGAVAFARCMRSHGIPNWPDPTSGGYFDKAKLRVLPVSGTRIRAIEDGPCNHLLPANGGPAPLTPQQLHRRLADWLSFAQCMRGHGVSRFPDPNSQGQLTVEMVQAQRIDVHSTAVLHVVQTCLPASHGVLTPAKVREAISRVGR